MVATVKLLNAQPNPDPDPDPDMVLFALFPSLPASSLEAVGWEFLSVAPSATPVVVVPLVAALAALVVAVVAVVVLAEAVVGCLLLWSWLWVGARQYR